MLYANSEQSERNVPEAKEAKGSKELRGEAIGMRQDSKAKAPSEQFRKTFYRSLEDKHRVRGEVVKPSSIPKPSENSMGMGQPGDREPRIPIKG